MATEIIEKGPWEAYWEKYGDDYYRAYVESEDFTHDAQLVVDGDFESRDQKFAYAQEIAKRLNAWSVSDVGEANGQGKS